MVINFAENVLFHIPKKEHVDAITALKFLLNKILETNRPFLSTDDVMKYCYPMRDMLIQFTPLLSKQLTLYWTAYVDMMEQINQKESYVQLVPINPDNVKQMGILSKLHTKTMQKFLLDPSNQTNLFALFYFHVLRVDTFEKTIKTPLAKLLKTYEVKSYDLEDIFSTKHKIKTKDGKYITDIRAIRNCLSHFKFEIFDNTDEWKIHFKSGDDVNDKIYYDELFSKEQFVEFLNNSNILYQSQFMLTSLLGSITYFKPFAIESLRIHKIPVV